MLTTAEEQMIAAMAPGAAWCHLSTGYAWCRGWAPPAGGHANDDASRVAADPPPTGSTRV